MDRIYKTTDADEAALAWAAGERNTTADAVFAAALAEKLGDLAQQQKEQVARRTVDAPPAVVAQITTVLDAADAVATPSVAVQA